MNTPLISIIIPAYNIEKYILNTLDSILNQTYRNIEIIIVDDGSEDNTPAIIDEYALKDCRVKVIHKENGGVTVARLTGVANANGDYIGFVDGDDYIEPYMFEKLISNALKYDADISHCGYQMVFPNRVDYYYNTGRIAKQDGITGLYDLLSGSFIEPGLWNKLFHKTLFHSLLHNQIMDSSIKINEDLLMNFYLFKESRFSVFEDICPYRYMVRKGSAANSSLNEHHLKDPLKVWQIIRNEVQAIPELSCLAEEKILRRMIDVSTMPLSISKELIKPYRAEIRQSLRKQLKTALKNTNISKSIKLMSVWAAYLPSSYQFVHKLYSKLKGSDKKYEIS